MKLLLVVFFLLIPGVVFAVNPLGYEGEISILDATENAMFNYFFTLVIFWGLVAFVCAAICKVLARS